MSEQNPELREDDKKPQCVLSDVGSNPTPGATNIAIIGEAFRFELQLVISWSISFSKRWINGKTLESFSQYRRN